MSRIAALAFSASLLTGAAARAQESAPAASGTGVESGAPVSAQPSSGHAVVHGGIVVSGSTGSAVGDLFLNLLTLGIYATAVNNEIEAHHEMLQDSWERAVERKPQRSGEGNEQRYGPYARPRHDAREGFLFSFGLGGGAIRYSNPAFYGAGALNFGLRMGYGFSDRFQLFGDFSADAGFYPNSREVTNWLVTLRGQTVLVGDTLGNGLNLNLGFGLGGVTINNNGFGPDVSSGAAPALVAGISYDARVGRRFALSPELYLSWHQVPNGPGFADDNIWSTGVRLNFLWYSPVY